MGQRRVNCTGHHQEVPTGGHSGQMPVCRSRRGRISHRVPAAQKVHNNSIHVTDGLLFGYKEVSQHAEKHGKGPEQRMRHRDPQE